MYYSTTTHVSLGLTVHVLVSNQTSFLTAIFIIVLVTHVIVSFGQVETVKGFQCENYHYNIYPKQSIGRRRGLVVEKIVTTYDEVLPLSRQHWTSIRQQYSSLVAFLALESSSSSIDSLSYRYNNDDDDEADSYSDNDSNTDSDRSKKHIDGNNIHVDRLWSYVYNLQRVRRQYYNDSTTTTTTTKRETPTTSTIHRKPHKLSKMQVQTLEQPVMSLLCFLQQEQHSQVQLSDQQQHVDLLRTMQDPLERSIIQAIRIESMIGNYRMIQLLVDAAIGYATSCGDRYTTSGDSLPTKYYKYRGIFNPRIIGEAITEMYHCQANLNKIKSLWTKLYSLSNLTDDTNDNINNTILSRPISAYEVNCMLQIYVQYNKPRAALDLYHQFRSTVTAIDAYSICLVLKALTASVVTSTESSSTTNKVTQREEQRQQHRNATTPSVSKNSSPIVLQNADLTPLLLLSSSTASSNHITWQWQEAIQMMDYAFKTTTTTTLNLSRAVSQSRFDNDLSTSPLIYNNLIWTALLKLNDACSCADSSNTKKDGVSHNGIKIVTYIISLMQKYFIQPDYITSTFLLSGLKLHQQSSYVTKNYYCNYAVALLRNATLDYCSTAQKEPGGRKQSGRMWTIAKPPNMFMYSAVMSLCASCKQYDTTIELLNEYEKLSLLTVNPKDDRYYNEHSSQITYLYNSVLQALTTSSSAMEDQKHQKRKWRSLRNPKVKKSVIDSARERMNLALELYHRMTFRNKIQPDTVTYNTLLSVLASATPYIPQQESDGYANIYDKLGFLPLLDCEYNSNTQIEQTKNTKSTKNVVDENCIQLSSYCSRNENLVNTLLDDMVNKMVDLDTATYKSAIRLIASTAMLSPSNDDCTNSVTRLLKRAHSNKPTHSKKKHQKKTPTVSMIDLYNECLFVFAGHGNIIGVLRIISLAIEYKIELNARSYNFVVQGLGYSFMTKSIPAFLSGQINPDSDLHKTSIGLGLAWSKVPPWTSLLDTNHFSTAISCCLQQSDFDSAKLVLSHMRSSGIRPTPATLADISRSYAIIALECTNATAKNGKASLLRAQSANSILSSITDPPSPLVAIVCKACCSAGMFREAQNLLRLLHKRLLQCRKDEHEATNVISSYNAGIRMNHLPQTSQLSLLQMELIRIVSSLHQDLLRFCADQGNVTNALSLCEDIQYLSKQLQLSASPQPEDRGGITISNDVPNNDPVSVGMTTTGWKSLLVAASKSGHWRVCLSTLQFLRPHLEGTRPSSTMPKEENILRAQSYGQLEIAINSAVKCLAVRSQYGWIVRVIDDWIEWSHRRPPLDAVLAAIRSLASRGRGEEVNNLLARCTILPSSNTKYDNKMYNTMLFVGAITTLYNEGLYDEADDAFVVAVTQSALPFQFKQELINNEKRATLDLHGMNLAVAHSAVRIALQQLAIATDNWSRSNINDHHIHYDMIIITGRGLNSALRMRPVLRPVVQRMLIEEFYPPLSTTSVPGNMGALCISSNDIIAWLDHQRQQKGARLLLVAAMLRNIASPGTRLRAALAHVGTGTGAGTGLTTASTTTQSEQEYLQIPTTNNISAASSTNSSSPSKDGG